MIGQRLVCRAIKLASLRVTLDLLVEAGGLIFIEPRAQPIEFARLELRDRLFDVFDSRHVGMYS